MSVVLDETLIRLYAIVASRPDFIPLMRDTFRKHLRDPHELIIINDGRLHEHAAIGRDAERWGVECHSVIDPRRDTANYAHARSIQWLYQSLVMKDSDISVLMDGDIFLMKPFGLREWMGNAQLCGVMQNRGHIVYPWAGLVFLNMATLPDRETLSFWPDKVDGVSCDVGGHASEFILAHPELRVKWIPQGGIAGDPYEMELFADAWLHYRAASNWNHKSDSHHALKTETLHKYIALSAHT